MTDPLLHLMCVGAGGEGVTMPERDTTVALVAAEMAGSDWGRSGTFLRQAYLDDVDQVFAAAERLGYAIVPVEPTEAMAHSGAVETIDGPRVEGHETFVLGRSKITTHEAKRVYRAMLAAAQES